MLKKTRIMIIFKQIDFIVEAKCNLHFHSVFRLVLPVSSFCRCFVKLYACKAFYRS